MCRRHITVLGLICLAVTYSLGAGALGAAEPTPLEDVIIYGIDSSSNNLLRYTFDTDTFENLGPVKTASGDQAIDTEALTWVPSGPAKGMYAAPRDPPLEGILIKINPFDGSAEPIMNLAPWKDICGMVTMKIGGKWQILAWDYNDRELIYIDPESKTITFGFADPTELEGLAAGPDGQVYGNTDTALYAIDLAAGSVTLIGSCGTGKMESLEFCYGDGAPPQISAAGIPAAWTANGVLLGFDDSGDELMIIDPATGDAMPYPCSFSTIDCEGIVTLTELQDPFTVVLDPAGD